MTHSSCNHLCHPSRIRALFLSPCVRAPKCELPRRHGPAGPGTPKPATFPRRGRPPLTPAHAVGTPLVRHEPGAALRRGASPRSFEFRGVPRRRHKPGSDGYAWEITSCTRKSAAAAWASVSSPAGEPDRWYIKVPRDGWLSSPNQLPDSAPKPPVRRARHPNIVAVHEIGEDQGQVFFAMELVEGESLAAFCISGSPAMATPARSFSPHRRCRAAAA